MQEIHLVIRRNPDQPTWVEVEATNEHGALLFKGGEPPDVIFRDHLSSFIRQTLPLLFELENP
jgi:hypothetical protein